jgi:hypothetical protein
MNLLIGAAIGLGIGYVLHTVGVHVGRWQFWALIALNVGAMALVEYA